jgi:hypothetical protein
MLELYILFICISVLLFVIYYYDMYNDVTKEAFDGPNYYLSACPSGFKMDYDNEGDIICHMDEGINISSQLLKYQKYQKDGKQCILNGKGTATTPNCVDYVLQYYQQQGMEFCAPSMPSYFENNAEKKKGCTRGELNETLTGPRFSTQPKCIIYPNEEDNVYSIDSCPNQKELEEYPCFGNSCTKQLVQYWNKSPLLLVVNFSDNQGMPHTAYSKKSLLRYLNVVWPQWKNHINLDRMIWNAEVAKKFYIDKTISKDDIDI